MSGRRGVADHGKHRQRRPGCHKHYRSPEVLAWLEENLPPPPPWMDAAAYRALSKLRLELERPS